MRGGAKRSLHYGDRTPALVLLAPVKGGVNPFTRVLGAKDGRTAFRTDVLREEMSAWADELDGPVMLGWAPGFLGDQRDRARRELADLIDAGTIVIDHPRLLLIRLGRPNRSGRAGLLVRRCEANDVAGTMALEVTVTAPVASFRNPLYAGVQVGLPCPPPPPLVECWPRRPAAGRSVDRELRFAHGLLRPWAGTDLETYHPLEPGPAKPSRRQCTGSSSPTCTLQLWLVDDLDLWERRLRRPVWPLRLGRSQDLVGHRGERTPLVATPGTQGYALIPPGDDRTWQADAPSHGRVTGPLAYPLGQLPVRPGRAGRHAVGELSAPDGRAVMLLPPTHPDQLNDG